MQLPNNSPGSLLLKEIFILFLMEMEAWPIHIGQGH